MLFNSLAFAIFFPTVLVLYQFVLPRHRWQLLLVASYVFYGFWRIEFLGLILASTIIDFYSGKRIARANQQSVKRRWLALSLLSNLGLLATFKYLGFFAKAANDLAMLMGMPDQKWEISIILPVGISFYTFQTLSYTIDIYRKKLNPEPNFARFALFVSFFPQLVAGPIERASSLLPQLRTLQKITAQNMAIGLRTIAWGFFLKVVVADRAAVFADLIYQNPETFDSGATLLGMLAFTFQIYGDFAGYSAIAIGIAQILGVTLQQNFNTPYFSTSLTGFWRRWHISLSTWFRDYVYIPLGGNQRGPWRLYFNLLIVFLVSGFWHGANWTFIAWGGLHGVGLMLERLLQKSIRLNHQSRLARLISGVSVFSFTVIAWTFFRSPTINDALLHLNTLFALTSDGIGVLEMTNSITQANVFQLGLAIISVAILLIADWYRHYGPSKVTIENTIQRFRPELYALLVTLICILGIFTDPRQFIYFQF